MEMPEIFHWLQQQQLYSTWNAAIVMEKVIDTYIYCHILNRSITLLKYTSTEASLHIQINE